MAENPNPHVPDEMQDFKGDNYYRYTGDTVKFNSQDRFAWDHAKKNKSELNSVAMPTLTEMMYSKNKDRSSRMKGALHDSLTQRYGGNEHYETENIEHNYGYDGYQEFDTKGEMIKRLEDQTVRSRYPEDEFVNDHTTVWGSRWNKTLKWGYQCCHSNEKYSNCLGRRGMKLAVIKEYKMIKQKETELLQAGEAEGDLSEVQNIKKLLEEEMKFKNIVFSNEGGGFT